MMTTSSMPSLVQSIKLGGDLGNSAVKFVFGETPEEHLEIPIAVKRVALSLERKIISEFEETMDTLDVIINCPRIPAINARYYIGNLAMSKAITEKPSTTRKVANMELLVPFLAGVALQAKHPNSILNVKAVMGLPISDFREKDLREAYSDLINGEYTVTFVSTAGKKNWTVTINLEALLMPEGVTVLINQQLNSKGIPLNPKAKQTPTGVLDIGAFTTDIPIIKVGGQVNGELSKGIQNGMASALDAIREAIARDHKIILNRTKLVKYLKEGSMPNGNETIDLKKYADEHFEVLASEIITEVHDIFATPEANEITTFYVCGGGAIALKPYLKELVDSYPHVDFIWIEENTIYQNAEGFWKLAMYRFKDR